MNNLVHTLNKPKKRLFIGLLAVSLGMILLLLLAVWLLTAYEMYALLKAVFFAIAILVLVILVLVGLGIGGIIFTLWKARTIPTLQKLMVIAINILFPIALKMGKIFGIEPDVIKSSFIEVNNQLVLAKIIRYPSRQVLLLAPHCIQNHDCPHKITADINNCKRCGRCQVGDLIYLQKKYGINVAVATGGTLARKFVREYRPKAIIAIACERDLTSGIQDSSPIPVIGILNDRPHGPCYDTKIDLRKVEDGINACIIKEPVKEGGRY